MSELNSFTLSESIKAPKAKVWEALFDRFGEVADFNPNILSSKCLVGEVGALGSERICEFNNNGYVIEKITEVSGKESFTGDIYETNLPMMKTMLADFSVYERDAENTNVKLVFRFQSKPAFMAPLMKAPMKNRFKKLLVGLKYHVETGKNLQETSYKQIKNSYKKLEQRQAFAA